LNWSNSPGHFKITMEIHGKKVRENVSLAPFTTFKVGGPAEYFFIAKTKEDLIEAVKAAQKESLPFFVLGGGSNLLVSDEGYKGLVVKLEISDIRCKNNEIYAGAGAELKDVVKCSLDNSLTGLEWASGIPGTVGGAIYGNAGAFGSFIEDVIKNVRALDTNELKTRDFPRESCEFSWKGSVFKDKKNLIILAATLILEKGNKKDIEAKIGENINYRKEKHPLDYPSAGCIFKNVKSQISNSELLKEFPEIEEFNKKGYIPAGFLVEKSGLKSKKIGGAQISEKHANFIINTGDAQAKDIMNLIKLVKHEVKDRFGVGLEEEVRYIGF